MEHDSFFAFSRKLLILMLGASLNYNKMNK